MLHWHESYFETWPIGRAVHALAGGGLALERLEELPARPAGAAATVRVPGELIVIRAEALAA